jgi:hypothetical protein
LFAEALILQSHGLQLLLDVPFLLIQLILSLPLFLQLSFQALLLHERLLITAAQGQGSPLQSRAGICRFGANRRGRNRETKQQASWFHGHVTPVE